MTTYTIKPLAWERDGEMWIADTPFGLLRIVWMHTYDSYRARYEYAGVRELIGRNHESLDAAKQACTKHWESLIKQALEEV